jgi:hypothetical protein
MNEQQNCYDYDVTYKGEQILSVQIWENEESKRLIKEMVEFWGSARVIVKRYDGDYNRAFLYYLAKYVLANNKLPLNEEGWYPTNALNEAGIYINHNKDEYIDDSEIEIKLF